MKSPLTICKSTEDESSGHSIFLFIKYFIQMKYFLFFFLPFICFGQQNEIVDFLKVKATIVPILKEKKIEGTVMYTFKVLQKTDSVYLDAINMTLKNTALEGVSVSANKDKIWLIDSFEIGREYTAFFEYTAMPKQTVYFTGDQVWTQGQGKYTSHWLPSLDDMNDKIEFDLTLVVPKEKTVIANGKLLNSNKEKGGVRYWEFDMERPMSSYLVAFAIGNFDKKEIRSTSGIPC